MLLFKKKRLLSFIMGTLLCTSAYTNAFASSQNEFTQEAPSFSGAFLAGKIANSEQQTQKAIDYFKAALKAQPNNLIAQKSAFLIFLTYGHFSNAVALAKELKKQPDFNFLATITLAVEDIRTHQYNLVKFDPKSKDYAVAQNLQLGLVDAWAKVGQKQWKEAIKQTQRLMLAERWLINYQVALIADASGHEKEAADFYARVFTSDNINQFSPYVYERVSIAYTSFLQRQNKNQEALTIAKVAERNLPNSYVLKSLREKVEKNEKIAPVATDPTQGTSEVLFAMGTLVMLQNPEFSQLYFQLSLAAKPNNDAALFQLGVTASDTKANKLAIDYFLKIPETSLYYEDAQIRSALAYAEDGDDEKAIKLFNIYVEKYPDDIRLPIILTGLYMRTKQFDNAETLLDKTIANIKIEKRSDWILFYQRGIALEQQKKWEKAEPDFRKSLELFPNQPEVLNYLGYSLIDRNEKLPEAVDMIKSAAILDPNNGFIVDSLGWAYYKLGRYDEALVELEKAVALEPSDPTINDHLGDAYWQVGRKRDAVFQWTYALTFKPDEKEAEKIQNKLDHGLPLIETKHNDTQKDQEKTSNE